MVRDTVEEFVVGAPYFAKATKGKRERRSAEAEPHAALLQTRLEPAVFADISHSANTARRFSADNSRASSECSRKG